MELARLFRKSIIILLLAIAAPGMAIAQVADSTRVANQASRASFKASQLIAPGALMATGAIIHFTAHENIDITVNSYTSKWRGDNPTLNFDSYVRFLPEVMHLGLGLIGAESEHDFSGRLIEGVWAIGSYAAIGFTLKTLVDSPRPDLEDNRSFPSGHAGIAFAGAELVRMEYGWGWGAGAYAVATGVCAMRLYNNKHWMSDLLFGAGAGILCAHIGGWLLEPTQKVLGINRSDVVISATVDPVCGAVCPLLTFNF